MMTGLWNVMNIMKDWRYKFIWEKLKKKIVVKSVRYLHIYYSHVFGSQFCTSFWGWGEIVSHCSDTVLSKNKFLEIAKND